MGGNKFAPACRFAGSGAMEGLWQVKNNIWLLGKTSRKRPDDKASTKKRAARSVSKRQRSASHDAESVDAFSCLGVLDFNFFNNAMLAISFLQWRIRVLPAAKFI